MLSRRSRRVDPYNFLRTMQERQQLQHQAQAPAPPAFDTSTDRTVRRLFVGILFTLLAIVGLARCERADQESYTTTTSQGYDGN
ncbi:hypothetical protein [Hymenobacter sp. GOD-10R]|uniref:hypothetical protein n=1 Tax=Hymenobacter sp. GOD-10R TaxID=3093922 RepID=UPI002D77280D|nr:hypothetical protein [Hymenobacter sp. GOD-10R]WRQ26701.1 hypothetical protein SD425_16635 [Hymenobacter sp. GOD-10R]